MLVSQLIVEGIAVIEIDRPPVNALAQAVRIPLLAAIRAMDADPAARAILIHGAGRHFIAGSDLREFDAPALEPLLNDVLLRLEACGKPVVAALHGATLGGGFELALACHYRTCTEDLSIGLPEITYGLLPGAGGTQRLPRLIDPVAALDLMLSGKPIGAARALELGVVDAIIDGPVLAAALRYTMQLLDQGAGPRPLRERSIEASLQLESDCRARAARAIADLPGLDAPEFIFECVQAAFHRPFDEALALSRRRFEQCRVSVASRALRHLFFAERQRLPDAAGSSAPAISRVAVVGAGTMGTGIALNLATSGFEVTLIDPQPAALAAGTERIRASIEASVAKGRLSADAGAAAFRRVSPAGEIAAASSADFVIEAIVEILAVKREVFAALDRSCRPGVVLASNTSTLDIDAIASATERRSRVIGMHFFSPANIMRLVEIVRGRASDPDAIAAALVLAKRMGKLGIVVGNAFGFVGNKMLYAYGRENQRMLLEGASPVQVDRALTDFGMAMGPHAVGDLSGLDVGYQVRHGAIKQSDDPRYYRVADLLVEAGRLGQKTGAGMYRYDPGSRTPIPDSHVDALIAAEAARLGITRRTLGDEEIVSRCMLSLINAGARLLATGIAASAADIDAIWCNGYGFPRRRGGPMFYADTLGLADVVAGIERYAGVHGAADWTAADLLVRLARRGETFAEFDARAHERDRPTAPA
jgi:3-hydroxyacyl-CoA dehydrogenase